MGETPTYTELEQRIRALEAELAELKRADGMLQKKASRMCEAEQIALLGHWELNLETNTLYWSDEIFHIFGLSSKKFGATYEAFLNTVHPNDREFVDHAYSSAVRNRTVYDVVHRLLLQDGTVKYVQEKCKTEYDDDGRPLRSLGTVQDITAQMATAHSFSGIVSRDAQMKELFEAIKELAGYNVPVLIQGESGTGKELVARAIHNEGPRAQKSFVPINCGALPEGLLESELFGHVKGAFTGAIRDKKGRFEIADGGTLFLDEVIDLPKAVQGKLLRVLQEGKFERVGGERTIAVDVRIISAANRDLKEEVAQGNFREDLFYRLKVVPLYLPPLRERPDDIALLADFFLEKAAREGHPGGGISPAALTLLQRYPWPGNVRELQSAIRFALIKGRGQPFLPGHLPSEIQQCSRPERRQGLGGICLAVQTSSTPVAAPGGKKPCKLEEQAVLHALTMTDGNKVKAAKVLGVGRATLYRFLKENPAVLS